MELLAFVCRLLAPKMLNHLLTKYVRHSNLFFLGGTASYANRLVLSYCNTTAVVFDIVSKHRKKNRFFDMYIDTWMLR